MQANRWKPQPLDEGDDGAPRQITNFTADRIYSLDFSPDARQIVCARGELSGYVVSLTNK